MAMNFGTGGSGFAGGGGGGMPNIQQLMLMLQGMKNGKNAPNMAGGGPAPFDPQQIAQLGAFGAGGGALPSTTPVAGGGASPSMAGGVKNPVGGIMSGIMPALSMAVQKRAGNQSTDPTANPAAGAGMTANPGMLGGPQALNAAIGAGGGAQLGGFGGTPPGAGGPMMGGGGGPGMPMVDPRMAGTMPISGGSSDMMASLASGAGGPGAPPGMPMGFGGGFGTGQGGAFPGMVPPPPNPSPTGGSGPMAGGGSQSGAGPFGVTASSRVNDPEASGGNGPGFLDWLKKPAFSRDASVDALASAAGITPGAGGMTKGQMIAQMIAGFANGASSAMNSGVRGSWLGAGANGVTNALLGARQYDQQSQRQSIMDAIALKKATQNENKPVTIGEGERLVDPQTGKTIAEGGVKTPSGETAQAIEFLAGGDPQKKAALYAQWFKSQTDPNKGKTNINVQGPPMNINIPGKEQVNAYQKYLGETFSGIMEADRQAPGMLANLDRLGQLLGQVDTGKLAPANQAFKGYAKSLGVDLEALGIKDDTGPAQAAQALSNQMTLQMRQIVGGMPGSMSDKDVAFLGNMVPNLQTTPEGRKLIIDFQKAAINRQQEVAKMARSYAQKTGGLDQGFYDQLAEYSAKNPIAPPVVGTDAERAALAPGTKYIGVDGQMRIKGP